MLGDEGVPHDTVTIAGVTRESLAVVERQSGNQYRFLLPGPTLRDHDCQRCLDVLASHLQGAEYLVASGSLPPGVPAGFYAEVGALARRHGARFVLDTSGSALAAAGPGIYLRKTSLRELEELSGQRLSTLADEERAALEVIASGRAQILLVSLGERGALLVTNGEICRLEAVKVEGVGSVGAGDSMVAGMILSLVRGSPLIEAVKFGTAAGAAALLRPGTELCRRDDTERIYRASIPLRGRS
jgi:6-phosphofructokinase 2